MPPDRRPFAQYKDNIGLEDILDSIDFTISVLYKIPIRKATRMGHSEKAEHSIWQESAAYEYFDIQFVIDLYPGADPMLQSRLGKLITQRRRTLRFRRQRNQALQQASLETGSAKPQTNIQPDVSHSMSSPHIATEVTGVSKAMSETQTTIKATTFVPTYQKIQQLDIFFDTSMSEAASEISMASTQAAHDAVVFPSRPRRSDGSEKDAFECPYCFLLVQIKTRRQWE